MILGLVCIVYKKMIQKEKIISVQNPANAKHKTIVNEISEHFEKKPSQCSRAQDDIFKLLLFSDSPKSKHSLLLIKIVVNYFFPNQLIDLSISSSIISALNNRPHSDIYILNLICYLIFFFIV